MAVTYCNPTKRGCQTRNDDDDDCGEERRSGRWRPDNDGISTRKRGGDEVEVVEAVVDMLEAVSWMV